MLLKFCLLGGVRRRRRSRPRSAACCSKACWRLARSAGASVDCGELSAANRMARCTDIWFSARSSAPSVVTLASRSASLAPFPDRGAERVRGLDDVARVHPDDLGRRERRDATLPAYALKDRCRLLSSVSRFCDGGRLVARPGGDAGRLALHRRDAGVGGGLRGLQPRRRGRRRPCRFAAYPADRSRSSSSAWVSFTTEALSCARCWTRPVAAQVLTSAVDGQARRGWPRSAVGTAMTAARRQRTRQLASANRDRAGARPSCPGRRTVGPRARGQGGREATGQPGRSRRPGVPAVACRPVRLGRSPGPPWRPRPAAHRRPSSRRLTYFSPARSPEPPPSACPPLTDPAAVAEIRHRSSTHYARTSHRPT